MTERCAQRGDCFVATEDTGRGATPVGEKAKGGAQGCARKGEGDAAATTSRVSPRTRLKANLSPPHSGTSKRMTNFDLQKGKRLGRDRKEERRASVVVRGEKTGERALER